MAATATRKANVYAGRCAKCAGHVAAGAGLLGSKVDGRWTVEHATCPTAATTTDACGIDSCTSHFICPPPAGTADRLLAAARAARGPNDCANCFKRGARYPRVDSSGLYGKVCRQCSYEDRSDLFFA